jgi:cardiolipin synthase
MYSSIKFFFLFVFVLSFFNGCSTLPNVSKVINDAPSGQEPHQIVSADGLLSPEKSSAILERLKKSVDPTDMMQRSVAVIESVSDSPLTKGNKVTLLLDGSNTYPAMFEAIRNAKDHINLETFILEDITINEDTGLKLADLLLQKQAEGVQVNILYDKTGCQSTPASFFQYLRDGGIKVTEFNPIHQDKTEEKTRLAKLDHRKILIIDGKIAFTGGVNISEVYTSGFSGMKKNQQSKIPWRDTDVQIEGPAVAEFQKLFIGTWERQKGEKLAERNYFPDFEKDVGNTLVGVVGSEPGTVNRNTFILYVSAITFAEHSIHITNAYFIPDNQTIDALIDAAKRGVDVKIILPDITDSALADYAGQYFYSKLLQSGVKLYRRKNALLHAKTLVIDDVWSTVGSTNMDFLSFSSNDEVNAVILSSEFAAEMEKMFATDLAASKEITLKEWKNRPLFSKFRELFVHLFSHLL